MVDRRVKVCGIWLQALSPFNIPLQLIIIFKNSLTSSEESPCPDVAVAPAKPFEIKKFRDFFHKSYTEKSILWYLMSRYEKKHYINFL